MRFALLGLFMLAIPLQGAVRITAPLEGSQVAGRTLLEATVDHSVARVEFVVDGRLAGVARKAPYRHIHDFGTDLSAHTIVAVAHSTDFKSSERAEIKTLALMASDAVTVNLVELPLSIRTNREVRAADIELFENGRRQQIDELRNRRGASHFVFVVDRSLSMSGEKFDAALAAVDGFRAALDGDDSASVIAFNHRVERPIAIPRDTPVKTLLRTTTGSGGTSLRDALLQVERHKRTIVIVISDGADRNSLATQDDVIRKAGSREITVYSFLLGEGNAEPLLRELAKRTGGKSEPTSSSQLHEGLMNLLRDLNRHHVAVYQSSNTTAGWRTVDARSRSREVTVTTKRKGYVSE